MRKDTDPCHDTDPSHPTHKYALDVVSGKIVAGPHVRAACKRHLDDLKTAPSRGFYFSAEKADYAIEFFPTVLELASEDHPQGFPFDLEPVGQFMVGSLFGWVNEAGFRRFRTAYIEMGKGNAKALSIDTPIPTPFGWSSMGDIAIGDIVFGSDGKQCRVIAATDTMYDRECYRLTFDDGERIIADAGHLWCTTSTEKKTKDKNIRTTKEIANTLRRKNGQYQTANHSVDICKPIECCEANLDINPYTFGMWIGDGDSDCGRITCGTNDLDETIYNLQNDGCVITSVVKTNTAWRVTISGLKTKLRDIGVLCNKMIPVKYMRASSMQRLELLRGLMDSDGTASKAGQCTFSSKNRGIAECVYELVNSLGIKAFLSSKKASIGATVYADAHCVSFFPPDAVDVFRLKRKACRKPKSHGRVKLSATRRIVACEQVDSVPVRCITVDARDSLYLCGNGMVPTHNSPLAAGIGMFGLLADGVPNAEIYAAASKRDQAMILFKDAVSFVERSEFLQDVIKTSGKRPNVWSLFHLESKSEFKPISSDDGQSGYRPHIALVDELHEHKNSVVVNMLTAGQKGLRQPLVFIITNSGSDVNTVCGEYHKNAIEIAHGITKDDAFFSYVCALDFCERDAHYAFDVSINKMKENCTCGAKTILTEKLLHPSSCAHLVIKKIDGEGASKKALRAKTILIDTLLQQVFAIHATRDSEKKEIQRTPRSERSLLESGQSVTPSAEEKETENTSQEKMRKPLDGGRISTEKEDSTCLPMISQNCSQGRAADAVYVDDPTILLEWIIATIRESSVASCAESAIVESACSEIMRSLYEGHSHTCRIHQTLRLNGAGLLQTLPPDDPFIDESCWIKTNPMLGVTIQNEYIRNQIASATMPSKRSEVKRLNFCIWTQADNPFIDYDAWAQARSKFSIVDLRSMECCMGLDLSQVRDLTAAVFSFRSGETVKWWPEFWIPEGVVAQKVKEDKIPYDTWIDKGWVRTTPGNSISLEFIARDIKQIIEDNDLTVSCLMYDRWRIEDFKIASNSVGLDVEEVMKEHGQGFKDMSPALDAFERDLVNRKFQHPGNPCLDWCAANAVVAADPAGGRKLDKGKNQKKRIDGIIAGVMSHHATSLQAESSAPDIRWL